MSDLDPVCSTEEQFFEMEEPMRLVPVKGNKAATAVLYELLQERPKQSWISHDRLPTIEEHEEFLWFHPFKHWYLIEAGGEYVGQIEATNNNEVGVAILKRHQRKGYATEALRMFLSTHQPLPPVRAVRNGSWLANIAVDNQQSKELFRKLDFRPLQETWIFRPFCSLYD